MEFGESKVDFQEADRRYAELKRQHEAGTINDREFEGQLKQLMVLDDQNRWWARSRRTGEWHYHDGNGWVHAIPPYEPSKPSEVHEPSIRKPSIDELLRICARYSGNRFYVGAAIPKRLLALFRSRFPIPADERVAALIDNPAAFSNGFGLAVCENGIRWRCLTGGRSGTISIRSLRWHEFASVPIKAIDRKPAGVYSLLMGEGNVINLANWSIDRNSLVQLLIEIQSLIKASPAAEDT